MEKIPYINSGVNPLSYNINHLAGTNMTKTYTRKTPKPVKDYIRVKAINVSEGDKVWNPLAKSYTKVTIAHNTGGEKIRFEFEDGRTVYVDHDWKMRVLNEAYVTPYVVPQEKPDYIADSQYIVDPGYLVDMDCNEGFVLKVEHANAGTKGAFFRFTVSAGTKFIFDLTKEEAHALSNAIAEAVF